MGYFNSRWFALAFSGALVLAGASLPATIAQGQSKVRLPPDAYPNCVQRYVGSRFDPQDAADQCKLEMRRILQELEEKQRQKTGRKAPVRRAPKPGEPEIDRAVEGPCTVFTVSNLPPGAKAQVIQFNVMLRNGGLPAEEIAAEAACAELDTAAGATPITVQPEYEPFAERDFMDDFSPVQRFAAVIEVRPHGRTNRTVGPDGRLVIHYPAFLEPVSVDGRTMFVAVQLEAFKDGARVAYTPKPQRFIDRLSPTEARKEVLFAAEWNDERGRDLDWSGTQFTRGRTVVPIDAVASAN